jgi:hypothetical protein
MIGFIYKTGSGGSYGVLGTSFGRLYNEFPKTGEYLKLSFQDNPCTHNAPVKYKKPNCATNKDLRGFVLQSGNC